MIKADPLANVLYIDLSRKRHWVERREDLFDRHLGGAGVAIELLHEECPNGADPLSPENPIVFAVGPLTGLFPLASKTVAMFKSPHTGNLGESHAGGRSAVAIRTAGYGAVVIRGANDLPGYVAIHGGDVHFRDARTLWGMRNSFTVGRIIRESEPAAGLRTIMRIGTAGEKLIPYACVATESYRHFGRLGLGAVFGSKKLKAVVVSGRHSLPIAGARSGERTGATGIKPRGGAEGEGGVVGRGGSAEYRRVYDEIYQEAVASPVMKKYHDLGTPENVLPLNALGGLPTRNLKDARFEGADRISGEALAERYLGRRLACSHCPVGCIHIAALREPDEKEPYFYKTSMISYDYELIYSLGSMLGGSDPEGLLKLIDRIEVYGLDAMSCGVVLAWATEAQERGLVSEDAAGGLRLAWGDYRAYLEAVRRIVEQPNEFYRALAHGVEHAASAYGGQDFALAFGGNEMPGYHTGPGAHLGFLVGARHSHLDSAGYSVDQKVLVKKRIGPDELAREILKEERWRQVLSSLVVCFFARGIYTPDTTAAALRVAGFECGPEDLQRTGTEIHRRKYAFKLREGFSFDALRMPGRIFETPSPVGVLDEPYLRKAACSVRAEIGVDD
ncbi:MAG: aldehyde ferredoxin oxidoreductase family protein [Firmicutes bacterium]|nr:aldehyde ferredoxin oxidoreductase family protein [Bacillota bacterium]MDH7496379.1 aldehyde ferredoxin oxidoreductase family protein [Bacillota bacterium]